MSIIFQIPHTARFLSPVVQFLAPFNAPVVGRYSFDMPANQNVMLLKTQPNVSYLIEQVTIGGAIPAAAWNSSLLTAAPKLFLKKKISGEQIFTSPYALGNYVANGPFTGWVRSDIEGDAITASVTGALSQISETVGVPSIGLTISFVMYAMDGTCFNAAMRDEISPLAGQQPRGA